LSHNVEVMPSGKTPASEEGVVQGAVTHIPPAGGTRSLWVFGELATHKIPSRRTGGAYAVFEVSTRPGSGPPPHVHHREDEAFYVLEGEYEFSIKGHAMKVEARSLVYVPKGVLHAHENVGEGLGRMLLTQTPGGSYEHFFEQVGKKAVDGEVRPLVFEDHQDMRRIVEVAAEHGIEIPVPIAGCSRA
jgi:mannose-6-phosphate isomerase-like protein (cupin superfamily)